MLKENQFSLTALMTAYIRGFHSKHDTPKIFDDFLAYQFIPEENRTLLEQGLMSPAFHPEHAEPISDRTSALAQVIQSMSDPPNILSRSRYAEDNLATVIGQGFEQYVILGAGFDTFAFRHPELMEQLQVFEVDHPDTKNFKQHCLNELRWDIPKNLHFIPVDFTKESLSVSLAQSSFNPEFKSFFSWLGVTYYLPQDAVLATLRTIADVTPAGSIVVFDYYDTDAFVAEKAAKRVYDGMEIVRRLGEPMITGFDPSTLAVHLKNVGFRLHENLTPANIQERYFQGRTDNYYACEHLHLAYAVVE